MLLLLGTVGCGGDEFIVHDPNAWRDGGAASQDGGEEILVNPLPEGAIVLEDGTVILEEDGTVLGVWEHGVFTSTRTPGGSGTPGGGTPGSGTPGGGLPGSGSPGGNPLSNCAPSPMGSPGRDAWGGLTGSGLTTRCTGFFRIERPGERYWLVDPAGNPWFGLGVNTVFRNSKVEGITPYLQRYGNSREGRRRAASVEWGRLTDGADGAYFFNNIGGFSDTNDLEKTIDNPMLEFAPYGVVLNEEPYDVAPEVRDAAGRLVQRRREIPWVSALRSGNGKYLGAEVPVGSKSRDGSHFVGDPFDPRFRERLQRRWAPRMHRGDPRLLYYWIGNETGLFDHPLHRPQGVRDLRPYIWNLSCPADSSIDAPRCSTHALGAMLRERYMTIDRLNSAWGTRHASFDAVLAAHPQPGLSGERACERACGEDLWRFVRRLWGEWIRVTTTTVRSMDPDHLVSSPRFSIGDSDHYCWWGVEGCNERFVASGDAVPQSTPELRYSPFDLFARNGDAGFDFVSLNAYSRPNESGWERPWFTNGVHKIMSESGLPILISEFGIRTRIADWTNRGGAGSFVPNQATTEDEQILRGRFYEDDVTQLISLRGIMGVTFHRWADVYETDGERQQINMGIIHRNGERWANFDDGIRIVNSTIYGRLQRATGW